MELTIRIGEALRAIGGGEQVRGRSVARAARRSVEERCAGILEAVGRRDFAALRAQAARMAEEGPSAEPLRARPDLVIPTFE